MSAVSPGRYRRSPLLLLEWSGRQAVLLHADTLQRFAANPLLVDALARLDSWTTAQQLGEQGCPIANEDLERLARLGILERLDADDDGREPEEEETGLTAAARWNPLELAVHRRTAHGGAIPGAPPPVPTAHRGGDLVALPAPPPLQAGLQEALQARRTVRSYAPRMLAATELSGLLHHAARAALGPDGRARRPFASAGARCELELYVVANDVGGLAPGAYHYDPWRHGIRPVRDRDDDQERINASVFAATGGMIDRDPPAILLVTAVFARMSVKYRDLSLSLIYKDVGCLLQTLYLVAADLGLAACAIGNGEESDNSRWLGLDPLIESQVGCLLVGPRASG